MTDISKAIMTITEAVKAVKNCSEDLRNSASRDEVEAISSISAPAKIGLEKLDAFFGDSDAEVEMSRARSAGINVSSDGKFYDAITGGLFVPFWYDGDMRIKKGADIKRCSTLVAMAFGIKSADPSKVNYIGYKDGDRRNLSPDNIFWYEGDRPDPKVSLIEDISRRLIDADGDIDVVLTKYQGSYPPVSREFIDEIKTKKAFATITDKFFTYEDGSIVPTIEQIGEKNGLDCYGLLKQTKDVELVEEMLLRKVGMNQKISNQEIEIMTISVLDIKVDKKASYYAKLIKEKFGCDVNPSNIGNVINGKSSTAKTISTIYAEYRTKKAGGVN